ncbi:aminodeoxychorismate synthase component I [Hahella sp. KA22]|uniref:aminodeoxychorismate synthase component I n=1 Tax=Hahella sp. KA22 TaxID=1628392 RepID=UPI000FDE6306|nr:aminodeoxychorismate synthase component I [Hahella sp. KA22]AZZ93051.1 aminodeoxychorismate synthase component I [Hahella sp. KA22]QAY56425.1 aminodeoxychorismate synthase component I [Hahella sp. KA22]
MSVFTIPYADYNAVIHLLSSRPGFCWLDSRTQEGRAFEIIACDPEWIARSQGSTHFLSRPGETETPVSYADLLALTQQPRAAHPTPCFKGGLIGFISYEFGRNQLLGDRNWRRDSAFPAACIGAYDNYLIVEHDKQTITGFGTFAFQSLLQQSAPATEAFSVTRAIAPDWSYEQYSTEFDRIKEYILAGDCYQINLTQRFSGAYAGDPLEAYINVRQAAKAPYSAFFRSGHGDLLCFSPEKFLTVSGRDVVTKPIKGTRPRGASAADDFRHIEDLTSSPKDRAENVMIVDLLRNDLGKISNIGSVKVEKLCALETYSNVHHLVSTVTSTLRDEVSPFAALISCSPGGSITGAPKKRAMEIIDELEGHARSAYCGSVFYLSNDGRMDSNIAIRTMTCRQGDMHVWGGGGIVADSDCLAEYNESVVKIRHIVEALGGELPGKRED